MITLRGVRTHNLQSVDLDLPTGQLIVFTGVSGSGKSSLAFDTLHREGRRRFVETLSPRLRQALDAEAHVPADLLAGLPPTIGVEQGRGAGAGGRATVATLSDVHSLLAILFARRGQQRCPTTGEPLDSHSADEILAALLKHPDGARLSLLAPRVRAQPGGHRPLFDGLLKEGFARVRVDGVVSRIEDLGPLDARAPHDIDVVIDRIRLSPERESRLAEAIRVALNVGQGRMLVDLDGGELSFSELPWSPALERFLPRLSPALMNPATRAGACSTCRGSGRVQAVDPESLIVAPTRSLRDGALDHGDALALGILVRAAEARSLPDAPWSELSTDDQAFLLHGDGEDIAGPGGERPFDGLIGIARRRGHGSGSPCPSCDGARLSLTARAVTLGEYSLPELLARPLAALKDELALHTAELPLLHTELARRLDFLERVGLGYLSLGRPADTLSAGELQRVRLAGIAGGELSGVLYILDEPTAGLHPSDTARLIQLLEHLRALGNTVIAVEHDPQVIQAADHVVDFGPDAGHAGGTVVFQGSPAGLMEADTLTGQWLSGRALPRAPTPRRPPKRWMKLSGCSGHNLRLDAAFGLKCLNVVTGPSGAGKSSLVLDTLVPALTDGAPLPHDSLSGQTGLNAVRLVSTGGSSGSARSNPATFSEAWGLIRALLSGTREARIQGFAAGHFSLNRKGGRCERCAGLGVVREDMGFLPDLVLECDVCGGARFDRAALRVRYRDHNAAELLALSVHEARALFSGHRKLGRILRTMEDVGLGYLPLGQAGNTLSGGEAQRLRIARDLAKSQVDGSLYVLDEPCVGLHPRDVDRLGELLHRLVEGGATVIAIEHDEGLIRVADHELRLGPGAGPQGGQLEYAGPPKN